MTKEEFETEYASRSGVTVSFLHAFGRHAEPCDCGDELCEGWQMGHGEPSKEYAPLTAGQALRGTECPTCGAKPGENCHTDQPAPEGKDRCIHISRFYAERVA